MERTKLIAARTRRFPRWSYRRVAEHIGLSVNTLFQLEKGQRNPRETTIALLCKAYATTAGDLGFEDEQVALPEPAPVLLPSGVATMTEHLSSSLRHNLGAQLYTIVNSRRRDIDQDALKALQTRVLQTTMAYDEVIDEDISHAITRRDALVGLILLPVGACLSVNKGAKPYEDILTQCAAGIAACRSIQRGKELQTAFDALSIYIPALQSMMQSPYRKVAASLITHCLIVKAVLARHVESSDQSVLYLQQAEIYAKISEDADVQMRVPRSLAATYYYKGQWKLAAQEAEQARDILETHKDEIPKSFHSFVYAGLATYQAKSGKTFDAKAALKLAHRTFGADNEALYIGHDMANLLHNDGLTRFWSGDYKGATDSLQQLVQSHTAWEFTAGIEHKIDRVRVEALRDDQPRDMDLCVTLLEQALAGIRETHSKQRFNELTQVYALCCAAWPAEQRLKELREQMVHW